MNGRTVGFRETVTAAVLTTAVFAKLPCAVPAGCNAWLDSNGFTQATGREHEAAVGNEADDEEEEDDCGSSQSSCMANSISTSLRRRNISSSSSGNRSSGGYEVSDCNFFAGGAGRCSSTRFSPTDGRRKGTTTFRRLSASRSFSKDTADLQVDSISPSN